MFPNTVVKWAVLIPFYSPGKSQTAQLPTAEPELELRSTWYTVLCLRPLDRATFFFTAHKHHERGAGVH